MIFTVANQKGGVGKTTFLINFAYYLKDFKNKSVLVIDTDTQANCSYSLGNANIIGDTYSLFTDDVNILAASANAYWFEHYNHIIKQDQYEKKLRAAGKAPPAGHKIWTALKQRFPKLFSLLKKILKRF